MSAKLERVEDLAGLDPQALVAIEITETVVHTAIREYTVEELVATAEREAAHDRDHLKDLAPLRDDLEDWIIGLDRDQLTTSHATYTVGPIKAV